jgi:chemotaxis protein methyltransferase CheR
MTEGVSFTDIKHFTAVAKDLLGIDFSNYAMASFRRRIALLMEKHNLLVVDSLIEKLKSDAQFIDIFLKDIAVPNTEMFRDPSVWHELKNIIMPKIDDMTGVINIWLPECTSGEDLISLNIMLSECGLYEKSVIHASFESKLLMDDVKECRFEPRKMELNKANYLRYNETGDFSKYISSSSCSVNMNKYLIKNVEFYRSRITDRINPSKLHLVIYRNKMCYFNNILQNDVLGIINESMVIGGFLIIGAKENISGNENKRHFKIFNEQEMIYKKTSK